MIFGFEKGGSSMSSAKMVCACVAIMATLGVGAAFLGTGRHEAAPVVEAHANDVQTANDLRQAAERGDAEAQVKLGTCYLFGIDAPEDKAEGLKRVRLAADQGNGEALFNLGCYCSFGIGVIQDDVQAVTLFRQAAEQGNVNAQYCLGVRYRQGLGVDRDEAEGLMWIRQAAKHGDAKAKEVLCELGK
jgi:TPR repeat protein